MSNRIVVVGAGGFGRGVLGWIRESPIYRAKHDISDVAYIDDAADGNVDYGAPILDTVTGYRPRRHDLLICAVADSRARRRIVGSMEERGARFHSFIDDRAVIGPRVRIGIGAVICPGVVISADATVDNHVHVNFNCSIGHDTRLGAFVTLSPAVNVMGEVTIREAAFLGGSALVLPRLEIAGGAIVGAGAVVTKSIFHVATYVGNPARPMTADRKEHHDDVA